jgi:cbb3-type cytochrome oxidase maturation protein
MAGMFGENPLQMLIPIAIVLGAVIIFAFWTAGF